MNTTQPSEEYLQTVVLPLYGEALDTSDITWKDHGQVGPDAWAHYFDDKDGREYVLLYEDFPGGDYLNDDLTHEVVKCGEETSVQVASISRLSEDKLDGYFTLYAEKTS